MTSPTGTAVLHGLSAPRERPDSNSPRGYTHPGKQRQFLNILRKHCTYLGDGRYLAATTFLAPLLGISQPAACQRRRTFARQTGAVIAGRIITVPLTMVKAEVKRLRWRADAKPYTGASAPTGAAFLRSDAHAGTVINLREGQQDLGPEEIGGQGLAHDDHRLPEGHVPSVCPACARPGELVRGARTSDGRTIDPFWTCRKCMQDDKFTGRTHLMWRSVRQWLWKQARAAASALSVLRDRAHDAVRRVNQFDRRTVLERNGWRGDGSWKTWLARCCDAETLHIIELASADLPDQRTWLLAHGYGAPDRFGNVPEWARP
jgi:hypothetical protein